MVGFYWMVGWDTKCVTDSQTDLQMAVNAWVAFATKKIDCKNIVQDLWRYLSLQLHNGTLEQLPEAKLIYSKLSLITIISL